MMGRFAPAGILTIEIKGLRDLPRMLPSAQQMLTR